MLLSLSMIGHIDTIIIAALPSFLFLFQTPPVYVPFSLFNRLDSTILSFVWANKPPCISKTHLQMKVHGLGPSLPVFRQYYWAANVRALHFW